MQLKMLMHKYDQIRNEIMLLRTRIYTQNISLCTIVYACVYIRERCVCMCSHVVCVCVCVV